MVDIEMVKITLVCIYEVMNSSFRHATCVSNALHSTNGLKKNYLLYGNYPIQCYIKNPLKVVTNLNF